MTHHHIMLMQNRQTHQNAIIILWFVWVNDTTLCWHNVARLESTPLNTTGTHALEHERMFWKVEPTFPNAFSKHFSMAWELDLGYESLKNASKTHSKKLVLISKIFVWGRYGEQKIAQFRTNYLTKKLAYVSTQSSGQLNTFLLNHFSVYWKVAWLLSTHVCTFLR